MIRHRNKVGISIVIFMMIMMLQGLVVDVFGNTKLSFEEKIKDSIILYTEDSNAIINNAKVQIDHKDRNVKPIVRNDRTLVPVRFIAEALGADVTWDQHTNTVTLKLDSKEVKLTIGSDKIIINNEDTTIDATAEIIYNRTYLPLRAVVEAFDKKVFYYRSLIIISDIENIFDAYEDKSAIDRMRKWFISPTDGIMALHVGSPIAFVNGKKLVIDNKDIKIKPIIKNDRTLVPVRFIAENLKVDINWNSVSKTVTLTTDAKTIKINIGSNKIFVDGEEIIIDVPAQIINSRTYLPLRAVVEAFDKKVLYDNGFIVIGDYENTISKDNEMHIFDEIKKYIKKYDEDAFSVISNSFKALENEDIDSYMNTVHQINENGDMGRKRYTQLLSINDSKYEMENQLMKKLKELFSVYDLNYEIESIGLMERLNNTVKVEVLRTVKKSNGSDFQEFRAFGVYTLSKINNEWKITRVQESIVEYLNDNEDTYKIDVTPLDFNVDESIMHPDPRKSLIYMLDKNDKKLYLFNYKTGDIIEQGFNTSQSNFQPDKIAIYRDEVYVTLLQPEPNKGVVATLFDYKLGVKKVYFHIDIDPSDIRVFGNYMYILSDNSIIKSYSKDYNEEVASISINEKGDYLLYSIGDSLYIVKNNNSKIDITKYATSNQGPRDGKIAEGIDITYNTKHNLNTIFKVDPRQEYIFNGSGKVFYFSLEDPTYLKYYLDLEEGFIDMAFNLSRYKFYTATEDGTIYEYYFGDFKVKNTYETKGNIVKLYYKYNNLIAITNLNGEYRIEKISFNE